MAHYDRLDFACNNAGIGGEQNPVAQMSVEGWNRTIAINLSGVFYCLHYEILAMLKNGGGAIVNMASVLGKVGFAGAAAYVSAKLMVSSASPRLPLSNTASLASASMRWDLHSFARQ